MNIKYSKAPLPFLGQKRNFVKLVCQLDFSGKTVVDLFGGSGLLSHTIKQHNPSARVIYNDFDNYQSRLDQIKKTEELRQQLQKCTAHLNRDTKLDDTERAKVLKVIRASDCTDWITISSWLLFSGHYAHSLDKLIKTMRWYAKIPCSMLFASDYLTGVERVRCNFRTLLKQYNDLDNVIYIADPPYVMTNQTGYSTTNDKFFRLKDAIDLVRGIHKNQTLFFSSPKSETEALFEVWQPDLLQKTQITSGIGGGLKAVDNLFFLNCSDGVLGSVLCDK